jgi:hypothetical protein
VRELSSGKEVTLVGASLKDVALELPTSLHVSPGSHLELHLRHRDHPSALLRAMVLEVSAGARATRVRAILHWADVDEAKRFSSILWQLRIDHLTEPVASRVEPPVDISEPRERIVSLLRALVASGGEIDVRAGDGRRALVVGSLRSEDSWPPCAFEVDARTPYADYSFRVAAEDGRAMRKIRFTRVDTRMLPLVAAPHGVHVHLRHPIFGEDVELSVQQISERALVVLADPVETLLHPGLVIDEARIEWRGGGVRVRARVDDVTPSDDAPSLAVVRVAIWAHAPASDDVDWRAWEGEVARLTHPNTFVGRPVFDEIWDVYGESGYFTLSEKRDEHFEPLLDAFTEASAKLAEAPHLGCHVTFCTPERVEATLAMLRAWEHSWLGYQLARRRNRPLWLSDGKLLYELYRHGYEHAGRDPAVRYQITFIQKSGSRISKLLHVDLPRRYGDRLACVLPFRAVEIRSMLPVAARPDIGPATEEEREIVLAAISLARPPIYVEALDLTRERFPLPNVIGAWTRAGLMRAREMLVARENGRPVAAAVLEAGQPGLHLFRLLDVVRLYPLGARGLERLPDLLGVAASWYLKRGLGAFVLFDEHGIELDRVTGHAIDLGWADLSIMAHELVPELLEECLLAVAPRSAPPPRP